MFYIENILYGTVNGQQIVKTAMDINIYHNHGQIFSFLSRQILLVFFIFIWVSKQTKTDFHNNVINVSNKNEETFKKYKEV